MPAAEQLLIRNRERAFVMVRLLPLRRLNRRLDSVHLARAMGLYVVLCQLHDEHVALTGGSEPLHRFGHEVAAAGGMSMTSLRQHVRNLTNAGVLSVIERKGPRGPEPSEWRLLNPGRAFVALQTRALESITAAVPPTSRLGHYAFYLTLHDLANDERRDRGGRRTLSSYSAISRRCGLSGRTLRAYKETLMSLGLLQTTKTVAESGALAPQIWDLIDAPTPAPNDYGTAGSAGGPRQLSPGVEPTSAGGPSQLSPGVEPTSAGGPSQLSPGAEPTSAGGPSQLSPPAESHATDPVFPATPGATFSGVNARATDGGEDAVLETPSLPTRNDDQAGAAGVHSHAHELCELMSQRTLERLGEDGAGFQRRPISWSRNRDAWIRAANKLLDCYPPDRIRAAIEFLHADPGFFGSQCLTMVDLERSIDKILARARAQQRIGQHRSGSPAFAEVLPMLLQAIKDYGAAGKASALSELRASAPILADLVEEIGWGAMCAADRTFGPKGWQPTYERLVAQHLTENAA